MRKCNNAAVGKKLTRYENWVRGCIVIMKQPIAHVLQFRLFSLNVLPQMEQNIAVGFGVHGMAFRGKFMVYNP
jgi:hypothetical protein